jgi:hypothetical protein
MGTGIFHSSRVDIDTLPQDADVHRVFQRLRGYRSRIAGDAGAA